MLRRLCVSRGGEDRRSCPEGKETMAPRVQCSGYSGKELRHHGSNATTLPRQARDCPCGRKGVT